MKVVNLSDLRTDRLYNPRKYSWYSFLLEAESSPWAIVRPESLCQGKIPILVKVKANNNECVYLCLEFLHDGTRSSKRFDLDFV